VIVSVLEYVCDSYELQNVFRIDKRKVFLIALLKFSLTGYLLVTETISCVGIQ